MSTQTEEWGQEDGKEELYRIGIPADLHTPQLEPGPIGIQLCGPVYKGCVTYQQVPRHFPERPTPEIWPRVAVGTPKLSQATTLSPPLHPVRESSAPLSCSQKGAVFQMPKEMEAWTRPSS